MRILDEQFLLVDLGLALSVYIMANATHDLPVFSKLCIVQSLSLSVFNCSAIYHACSLGRSINLHFDRLTSGLLCFTYPSPLKRRGNFPMQLHRSTFAKIYSVSPQLPLSSQSSGQTERPREAVTFTV